MRSGRNNLMMLAAVLSAPLMALAGVAETSATASSTGRGPGVAEATATYDGDGIGMTRTKATSGRLNIARGLSVGFDADGLTVSNSYALAGRFGPAVGGTFNLHLGLDGKAAVSTGQVTASGDRARSVTAGGAIGETYGRSVNTAHASGATGRRGRVEASTHASESGRRGMAVARSVRAVVSGRR